MYRVLCSLHALPLMRSLGATANAHLLRFYNTKLKPACNDLVWEINPRHAGAGAGMLRALTLSHLGERGWKGGREKPEQTQLHTQIELLLTPSTKSHKTKLIIVRQPVILVWFSKPATPTQRAKGAHWERTKGEILSNL